MAAAMHALVSYLAVFVVPLSSFAVNAGIDGGVRPTLAAGHPEGDNPVGVIAPPVVFADYVHQFQRSYDVGTSEYEMRERLFHKRVKEVHEFNGRPDPRWTSGINALTDRTEEELSALRGYRQVHPGAGMRKGPVMLFSNKKRKVPKLPEHVDWRQHLKAPNEIMDQGPCGSCWAITATVVLRSHAELFQKYQKFSIQQMLDCTPNRNKCGGTGGCDGATANLGLDYAWKHGLKLEHQIPYLGTDGKCPVKLELSSQGESRAKNMGGLAFGMTGWKQLPQNEAEPLLLAVYESGPVAVSVAGSATWNSYMQGIFDNCEKAARIDHAVVLVGFGENAHKVANEGGNEGGKGKNSMLGTILSLFSLKKQANSGPMSDQVTKYWLVQNSWGSEWGERGYMRILRRDAHEENNYCGWDTEPQVGTGCEGGPSKVWVCGSCGILYDSGMPEFRLSDDGWWAREGGRTPLNSTL